MTARLLSPPAGARPAGLAALSDSEEAGNREGKGDCFRRRRRRRARTDGQTDGLGGGRESRSLPADEEGRKEGRMKEGRRGSAAKSGCESLGWQRANSPFCDNEWGSVRPSMDEMGCGHWNYWLPAISTHLSIYPASQPANNERITLNFLRAPRGRTSGMSALQSPVS